MASRPPCTGREPAGQPAGPLADDDRLPQCAATRPARGVSSPFQREWPGVSNRLVTLTVGSAMGRSQCGRGATPGPLEEPGGGHEPCSPGQRGPFLRCGYSAITAGVVRPGGEPGAFRAARLYRPSCPGTARARGFRVPARGADQATGKAALAPCRRRGFVQRDRLRRQARYPRRPAVGAGAETAGRGLVAAGSSAGSGRSLVGASPLMAGPPGDRGLPGGTQLPGGPDRMDRDLPQGLVMVCFGVSL